MTDKTTKALKLAEEALYAELESDTCEEFAEAAEKCHKALAAIREALADHSGDVNEVIVEPAIPDWVDVDDYEEPVKQEPIGFIDESDLRELSNGNERQYSLFVSNKGRMVAVYAAPVQPINQQPMAVISESAIGLVKLHSNGACLPFGTQLYAAPVQPVKQEPVAYTNKEQVNELIKESARLIGSIKDEGDQYLTAIDALRNAYRIGLKDSPVDAKAIRAEALEEAAKRCDEYAALEEMGSNDQCVVEDCAAAIRRLK